MDLILPLRPEESCVVDCISATFNTLVMDGAGGFNYRWVYGLDKLSVKITGEGTNRQGPDVKQDILKDYRRQDRLGSTTNITDQFGRVPIQNVFVFQVFLLWREWMKRGTNDYKLKKNSGDKSDALKSRYSIALCLFDVAALIIFFATDIIGSFYRRIGPPTIVIILLFYFIYERKKWALIGYYIVAILGTIIGIISAIMIVADVSIAYPLFGFARIISSVAYASTAIVATLYQKNE